jgi:hypothetical protein
MKSQKSLIVMLVLLVAGMSSALAHGGRGRVGVYFGPFWGPAFYPPPFYYSPQVVVVPAEPPPVYIEKYEAPAESAPAVSQQYWYYCNSGKGYYPYVKECPDGWQKVLPQPAR